MKYSLRSLMIVVTLVCVESFLLPQTDSTPLETQYSWNREQRTVMFVVAVVVATAGVRTLARSSSYEKT